MGRSSKDDKLGRGTSSLNDVQLAAIERLLSTSSPVYTNPSRAI